MAKFIIRGAKKLKGELKINGAKNAALPIIAACLLVKGEVQLKRIPDISDVKVMINLLEALGAKIETFQDEMIINAASVNTAKAPYELVKKIHASFDIAGPLLSRFKEAQVPLPGGCVIGGRAVNLHIDAFRALGASVVLEHGLLKTRAKKIKGNKIYFKKISVGATKNALMAAVLASGTTIIENAALEPEVVDLANFLKQCGSKIYGIGTPEMKIEGVPELHPPIESYKIISDRIEAGTYLLAALITRGEIKINSIDPKFLEALLKNLEAANQKIERGDDSISLKFQNPILPLEVTTMPYPGFPTDLQPLLTTVLTLAKGTSIIEETIFDARFNYIDELRRMGANILVKNKHVLITGVESLTGAPVEAPDIRAGAALVLAALSAQGESEISNIEFIDRGYEQIEKKLNSLGAEIRRI
ncbi:MAG: UDP-N-acetylglucosamine 1-carboxyvinyltransferase [Armatimonadetes bacterium]|nr:UDP-N-acetylglucosamine 1-carboxyvinyltransferase [Armatimonadota bacterium]